MILLFVGLHQEEAAIKQNLWWILLLVLAPMAWMIVESVLYRRERAGLDIESDEFMEQLRQIPALPWDRTS